MIRIAAVFVLVGCTKPEPSVAPPPTVAEPPEPAEPAEPAEPQEPEEPAEPAEPPEPEASAAPVEAPPEGFVPIPDRRRGGFPGIAFAKIRAFAFDLENSDRPECSRPVEPDGRLCKTVERPGVELTPAQTKTLLGLLRTRGTWGSGSKCFLPHHGFVFYDDADVPVAEISVCFMCNMLISSPAIPKATKVGTSYGLSEKGNAALRKLCTDLGLPKCDAKNPTEFDAAP